MRQEARRQSASVWGNGRQAGSPSELRAEFVRQRLMAATLQCAGELGYPNFAVRHVIAATRTSRATFYKHFTDKADCFAQAHAAATEDLAARIFAAAGAESDWRSGVRAGLAKLLELVAAEPETARALLIETQAAGKPMRARCAKLTARFAAALDAARGEELPHQPQQAGTYVVGGVSEVVVARLRSGETDRLGELLPGLVQFALLPYFGEQAADQERTAAVEWAARRRGGEGALGALARSGG